MYRPRLMMPPTATPIFELPLTVRTYDTDRTGRLAPGAVCRYFQEAAALHADAYGWGGEALMSHGHAFVLSRLGVRFHAFPGWKDELLLRTWSRGPERIFYYRDFEIITAAGQPVATGSSAWLLFNIEARRVERPSHHGMNFPHVPERKAMADDLLSASIGPPDAPEIGSFTTAAFSDIDVNNHVNNTRFIDWAIDACAAETAPQQLVANFLAEVRRGDRLDIAREREQIEFRVSGKPVCRVRFVMQR